MCISNVTLSLSDPYLSNWLIVVQNDAAKAKDIKTLHSEFVEVAFIEDSSLSSNIFYNRRQHADEDARSFGKNLFSLARTAFGSLDPVQLKLRVKEKFLRGLQEPVGRRVRQLLPATYEDAVRFATAAESELEDSNVMEITDANDQDYFSMMENGKRDNRICFKCRKVGHIARFCENDTEDGFQ